MKIDFDKLIIDSGEKITKIGLAREMTEAGIFKSVRSAENMIQFHQSGKAKSCDYELLQYLMKRFNKNLLEIIDIN
ncbi:MAG: hypothetical protein ABFC18_03415 [Rikenellaceae bacterium]